MKHEVILLLDALNAASEKLLLIQGMVNTEQDIRAIQQLMTLAVEYMTQLNLILLLRLEEINDSAFKIGLTISTVQGFVDDVNDLRVGLDTRTFVHSGIAL